MKYNDLLAFVQSSAGLRLRLKLQPLGGEGDTIFPSTVAGGRYLISPRRVPGRSENVPCVIVDSTQSQANRLEDALLNDIIDGNIFIPHVATDFSGVDLIKSVGRDGRLTCFDVPHRVFDAILRDSMLGGVHFPISELGKQVVAASAQNATGLLSVSPASLLFGSWDSTGVSGGLGEKYGRCVVSELIGVHAEEALRAGVRRDPLEIASEALSLVFKDTKDEVWETLRKKAKAKKKDLSSSSDINHSSVPWGKNASQQATGQFSLKETADGESFSLALNASSSRHKDSDGNNSKAKSVHGGITCEYIQQTTTISFAALRQLRFPVEGKKNTAELSAAAHAVLAAIAIHAVSLNTARGWRLRSRCDLVPADGERATWEILGASGATTEPLDVEASRKLLKDAIEAARTAGLPWRDQAIELTPSPALAKLVQASQKAHRDSTEDASN